MLSREKKLRRLTTLREEAATCARCTHMPGRPTTLSDQNGPVEARCLVVGTAPGGEGELLSKPLSGDHAGTAFERLLDQAGLERSQLFITNAVLCTPRTNEGRGRRPRLDELRNCSHYLSGLIVLLDPVLIVTLGSTALRSLEMLAPHEMRLQNDVGRPARWMARWLLPLYHPGPRAMIHRTWGEQKRDYALWKSLLEV